MESIYLLKKLACSYSCFSGGAGLFFQRESIISNLCIMGFDSNVQCALAVGHNKTEIS